MKRYLSIFLVSFFLALSVSFVSCKKDNEDLTPRYELRFTNTSNNPYLIEVDGNSSTILGKTFKNYSLEKGTYAWKISQQSGYLLFPTIQEGTINLDRDKEVVFP
ncbi:MAG: hypothetical protein KJ578_04445 [Bacteroidetes bacterium]|nr:hypothetical protein [Bacteroidota bacterium]MBU1579135.1 hypothetical protein [Bacteroidota bacterium]MBU2557013.1 hypothetical protein [Bacteroidota bacterium]